MTLSAGMKRSASGCGELIITPFASVLANELAWWSREDSNLEPSRPQRDALSIELRNRAGVGCDFCVRTLLPSFRDGALAPDPESRDSQGRESAP